MRKEVSIYIILLFSPFLIFAQKTSNIVYEALKIHMDSVIGNNFKVLYVNVNDLDIEDYLLLPKRVNNTEIIYFEKDSNNNYNDSLTLNLEIDLDNNDNTEVYLGNTHNDSMKYSLCVFKFDCIKSIYTLDEYYPKPPLFLKRNNKLLDKTIFEEILKSYIFNSNTFNKNDTIYLWYYSEKSHSIIGFQEEYLDGYKIKYYDRSNRGEKRIELDIFFSINGAINFQIKTRNYIDNKSIILDTKVYQLRYNCEVNRYEVNKN